MTVQDGNTARGKSLDKSYHEAIIILGHLLPSVTKHRSLLNSFSTQSGKVRIVMGLDNPGPKPKLLENFHTSPLGQESIFK